MGTNQRTIDAQEPELVERPVEAALAALLAKAGFAGDFSLRLLKGGANNKVFCVHSAKGAVLAKIYFKHPGDARDRLGTEFAFCRFASRRGIRRVPEPLACDPANQIGLYEFIEGRLLEAGEIARPEIGELLDFHRRLNEYRGDPEARNLPPASDACFTFVQHLKCVETRLNDLKAMASQPPVHAEARDFVRGELAEAWKKVQDFVLQKSKEIGLAMEEDPFREDRRLSPSDIGFHNALRTPESGLRFIDFEYAGWDDPVKTACDIFCLQGVPVPWDYHDIVLQHITADLSDPAIHRERFFILMPVHRLKWCCILLNHFRPVGHERRRFAQEIGDVESLKKIQLEKARRALHNFYQGGFI